METEFEGECLRMHLSQERWPESSSSLVRAVLAPEFHV